MDRVERHEDPPTPAVDTPGASPAPAPVPDLPDLLDLLDLCPYLATTDGNWRSSSPVREHRCVAVSPAVPLAFEKQRRLCLVANHANCATYGAAVAAHPAVATAASPRRRVIARTTPVVLDQGRFELRLPSWHTDRMSGQGLLVGVLAIAFAAIVIARLTGDGGVANGSGTNPSALPSPTVAAAVSPAPSPTAEPSRAPVVTARPIGSRAPAASTQPVSPPPSGQPPASGATYEVKSGDTLSAIAARFKTTVKVLVNLNQISDPSKLHVGQVLQLP